MRRVVFDTVVLVSAFITEHKQGISAALLEAAERGAFRFYLSTDIPSSEVGGLDLPAGTLVEIEV